MKHGYYDFSCEIVVIPVVVAEPEKPVVVVVPDVNKVVVGEEESVTHTEHKTKGPKKDVCGVVDGPGILAGKCDCAGREKDCLGVCGGKACNDNCGVCNGPGKLKGACNCNGDSLDCNGICGG